MSKFILLLSAIGNHLSSLKKVPESGMSIGILIDNYFGLNQVGCIPCTINGIRVIEWMNNKTP